MGRAGRLTAADRVVLEERAVPDPMMTTALLVAKRARSSDPMVGRIKATGNAMTRIGALCYVRRREPHHERAAERFKSMYEALYGSGMPAVDAGRVQVDTSIRAHDADIAARIDEASELIAVLTRDKATFDLLVAVIVLGVPCEEFAAVLPSGVRNRRHVVNTVDRLLEVLDRLSEEWGYQKAAA